jgi:GMP synthase-like glutamine amidotransferase
VHTKPVLILKHIDIEGPGTLADFLDKHHLRHRTTKLYKGNTFPEKPEDYSAIISLGGPMNVYEEDRYPFLKWENDFLQRAIKGDVPVLGLCLGAQLIAKAAGARVSKNPVKEIGWFDVSLTSEGLKDPVFKSIGNKLHVFQWHGDTFEIPKEGAHLASSTLCQHQALKVGQRTYGLQFHLEVDEGIIALWAEAYKEELASLNTPINPEKLLWEARTNHKQYHAQATTFYKNFFRLAQLVT